MKPKRVEIIGVPVDCVTRRQALDAVKAMLRGNQPQMVIAVNPEKVMKARRDSSLLRQLQRAALLIPDGIGVVLAGRLLRKGRFERVPGSELMPMICEMAARERYKVFLFGASPEVNTHTVETLRANFPEIQIVGNQHGYVKEEEHQALIRKINDSQAEILFVALGSPKQEDWMEHFLPELTVKVCQGVGGTFDVLSGRVHRAPLIFRKLHLEWLCRLVAKPTRAVRQSALPQFAFHVLRQALLPSSKNYS